MIFATSPHFFLTSLTAFFPLERSVQRSGVCPLTNLLATHKIFIFYHLIYYLNIFISLSCILIYILFQYIKSIVPWTVLLSFTIIYPVYNFISFSCILIYMHSKVLFHVSFQYTLLSKVLFHKQYFCPSLLYILSTISYQFSVYLYIYFQKYCSSILYYQKYCSMNNTSVLHYYTSCLQLHIIFLYTYIHIDTFKSIVHGTIFLSFTIIHPVYNFISFSCILIYMLSKVLFHVSFQYTLLSKVLFHKQYFCPSLLYILSTISYQFSVYLYIYFQKYCSSILYYQKYCSMSNTSVLHYYICIYTFKSIVPCIVPVYSTIKSIVPLYMYI